MMAMVLCQRIYAWRWGDMPPVNYRCDDLFAVATLGFRGEALPSIAGVSEFELASRVAGAEQGQVLRLEAGVERAYQPCAMPQGTRLSVRNLFYNVPVRLKFLRGDRAENGHVTIWCSAWLLGTRRWHLP